MMPHRLLVALALPACRAPEQPAIHIDPVEPTSNEDLLALPAPPTGALWSWEWTRNGTLVPEVPGDRVPAELTSKGDLWAVSVQSHIGARVSEEGKAEVFIDNSPPLLSVRLSPDPIVSGTELQALATALDPDEDPVSLLYVWTRNGSSFPQNVSTVPASEIHGGDDWLVTVTADDGEDSTTTSAEGVANNAPPRITDARIEPTDIDETSVLQVVWDAADPDGDAVDVTIQWEVDGVFVETADSLDGTFFDRDDQVRARVIPRDGASEGEPYETAISIVQNTAPSATGVIITPSVITEGTIAACSLEDPYDLDGDLVTTEVRWYNGGTLISIEPVLSGISFSKGDVIGCEAAPTDGDKQGPSMFSDFVDIDNSIPSVGIVTLDPAIPTAAGPVDAIIGGVYDPDPVDTPTASVRWFVDGIEVAEALSIDGLVRGQLVYAEAVADDGEDLSSVVQSAEVVVGNALPIVWRAAMIPALPTSSDEVSADTSTADADLDGVTLSIEWFADDVSIFVGDPLPAGLVSEGDHLFYIATPSDLYGPGIPSSSPEVIVGNGAPSITAASISPVPLDPSDTASCLPSGASDPDGDTVTYARLWWINGVDSGTGTTLTGFSSGDIVRCQLTPTDGSASGDAVWSAPATVQ